jgi:hypothetical protein
MEAVAQPTFWRHLADAPRMLMAPRSVFRRIADDSAYGWALTGLLLASLWIGWATVQTGFVDRAIGEQTRQAQADLEREQAEILRPSELSERMAKLREASTFTKLIARMGGILGPPIQLLVSLMLIASVLFAAVALAGSKADYATLLAIGVYSAVTDVMAAALRLVMMIVCRSGDVRTSLDLLVPAGDSPGVIPVLLLGVDPFRVWFWVLVAIGLIVTGQLSRRTAIVTCTVLAIVGSAIAIVPALAGGAART